jgi:hypothetical protein
MNGIIFVTALVTIGLGCVGYILSNVTINSLSRNSALPPPERSAERMYGQQYFERAVKRG